MYLKTSSCRLLKKTTALEEAERNWQPVSFVVRSTGSVGRPRFEISKDQLEYLVEYELKTSDIAEGLVVSVSTIKKRDCENYIFEGERC